MDRLSRSSLVSPRPRFTGSSGALDALAMNSPRSPAPASPKRKSSGGTSARSGSPRSRQVIADDYEGRDSLGYFDRPFSRLDIENWTMVIKRAREAGQTSCTLGDIAGQVTAWNGFEHELIDDAHKANLASLAGWSAEVRVNLEVRPNKDNSGFSEFRAVWFPPHNLDIAELSSSSSRKDKTGFDLYEFERTRKAATRAGQPTFVLCVVREGVDYFKKPNGVDYELDPKKNPALKEVIEWARSRGIRLAVKVPGNTLEADRAFMNAVPCTFGYIFGTVVPSQEAAAGSLRKM